MTTACTLCGHSRNPAFEHAILNGRRVTYYHCEQCGLLQTDEPTWLAEAYSEATSPLDAGLVARNAALSRTLSAVLSAVFDARGTFIDIGGGHGLLTRWMRDYGFNFYWTDKYAQNLFARGFEVPANPGPVQGLVACEVMEHIPDAKAFLQDIFSRYLTKTLVFTTLTYEGAPPGPDWWYYAFSAGQHVSFYTRKTLHTLAETLGTRYYPLSDSLHIFTDRAISSLAVRLLSIKGGIRLYGGWRRFWKTLPSKTEADREWISKQP